MSELSLTRAGTRWGKRKPWWLQMKDKLFLHTSCPPCASFLDAVSHTGSDSLVTPGHYEFSSTYFVVCVDLDLWFKFFLKSWRKHPLPPFQQRITHTGLVGVFPHRFPCISLNILKPPSSLQEFPLITCIFLFFRLPLFGTVWIFQSSSFNKEKNGEKCICKSCNKWWNWPVFNPRTHIRKCNLITLPHFTFFCFFFQIETPSETMGPFCGHTPPPSPLLTQSHKVKVLFTTDSFGTNKGFSLRFGTRGADKILALARNRHGNQVLLVETESPHTSV